jgi:hypothetical protein
VDEGQGKEDLQIGGHRVEPGTWQVRGRPSGAVEVG